MLGFLDLPRRKGGMTADDMLDALTKDLAAGGIALAGAVQSRRSAHTGQPAQMLVRLLHPGGGEMVISQALGPQARGCRLDADALEDAARRAAGGLRGAQLVILGKFGRQEAAGRGFRTLIAEALDLGLPVLVAVSPEGADAFADFAGGMAQPVAPDRAGAWCRAAVAAAMPVATDG